MFVATRYATKINVGLKCLSQLDVRLNKWSSSKFLLTTSVVCSRRDTPLPFYHIYPQWLHLKLLPILPDASPKKDTDIARSSASIFFRSVLPQVGQRGALAARSAACLAFASASLSASILRIICSYVVGFVAVVDSSFLLLLLRCLSCSNC